MVSFDFQVDGSPNTNHAGRRYILTDTVRGESVAGRGEAVSGTFQSLLPAVRAFDAMLFSLETRSVSTRPAFILEASEPVQAPAAGDIFLARENSADIPLRLIQHDLGNSRLKLTADQPLDAPAQDRRPGAAGAAGE